MTAPLITAFVAAILALIFLVLQGNVIRRRVATGISLYYGDDRALAVAVRRHGNLTENVALAVILLALLEMLGGPDWVIYTLGFALILARIVHPFGLDFEVANKAARAIGATVTMLVMAISAIWLIAIYFST